MPFLDLAGARLHHTDRPADPDAEPAADLLLLPGYGLTSRVWEPMTAFLPRGHRVVALDPRNHGRSGTTATSTLTENVDDVLAAIEALGLDRPVVVGSSVGAVFAGEAARRGPDLVGAAVLVGGVAHAAVTVPGLAEANAAMIRGYREDLRGTAERSVPHWFGPLVGPRVHAWAVEQVLALRVPDVGLGDELATYDPRPWLPAVEVPVHVVHGALDAVPAAVAQEAAGLLRHGSFTRIEHVAHMPHVEAPGLTAGILTELITTAVHAGGRTP